MLRRSLLVWAAALALGALVLPGARADHCDGERGAIYLFARFGTPGGAQGTPTAAIKGVGCIAGETPELLYVLPANQIQIRYAEDLKVAQITGHVKGLGLDVDIVLRRQQGTTQALLEPVLGATYLMDSPWLDIDPSKTGNLVVTVILDGVPVTETFKTVV